MRRLVALLSLAVVLAGPAFGQAEAAESLARTLAERLGLCGIEPTEAPTCDAPSLVASKSEPRPGPNPAPPPPPALDGPRPIPWLLPVADHPGAARISRPPLSASRRQSLLQLLLC